MVLFLLPLLFNPFGQAFSWLPFLYLSTWPLIVHTSGPDTLITHALVSMLFVLTCDVTRRLMLKLIGFDLISLPAGLALLIALATDKGSALLSLLGPIFACLLALIEPLFLMLEIYVSLSIIRNFNRWLTKLANVRDEESQDLSNWEPPLTRASLSVRAFVILLTLLSYTGLYLIVQESKSFLIQSSDQELPATFNHAIAALVTLQLIAVSLTIYKEDGILSESAMVALLASAPIFVASLSYHHAKQSHLNSSGSSWTSYFPFWSLFGSPSPSASLSFQDEKSGFDFDATSKGRQQHLGFSDSLVDGSSSGLYSGDSLSSFGGGRYVDFGQLESSLLDGLLLDGQSKKLLSAPLKQLIMIINSILGLSVDKVAKYYFTPDFWYILLGRAFCIGCWTMGQHRMRRSDSPVTPVHSYPGPQQEQTPLMDFLWSLLNRTTIVKLLLILAYSQMLIQQTDNQAHLVQDLKVNSEQSGCCEGSIQDRLSVQSDSLSDWFNCMWSSAKACSSSAATDYESSLKVRPLFVRIVTSMMDLCVLMFDFMVLLCVSAIQKLASIYLLFSSVGAVWITRWRSPIVHRLVQSMLIQLGYIGNLLVSADDHRDAWMD